MRQRSTVYLLGNLITSLWLVQLPQDLHSRQRGSYYHPLLGAQCLTPYASAALSIDSSPPIGPQRSHICLQLMSASSTAVGTVSAVEPRRTPHTSALLTIVRSWTHLVHANAYAGRKIERPHVSLVHGNLHDQAAPCLDIFYCLHARGLLVINPYTRSRLVSVSASHTAGSSYMSLCMLTSCQRRTCSGN